MFDDNFNEAESYAKDEKIAKHWAKIERAGLSIIGEYLKYMNYRRLAFVGCNEWVNKFLAALTGLSFDIYMAPIDTFDYEAEGVTIYKDYNEMLEKEEVDVVIDVDAEAYKSRYLTYDSLNLESCVLQKFFVRITTTEYFRWQYEKIPYEEEMLDEFADIMTLRYKDIALYGNSEFIDVLYDKLVARAESNVIRLRKSDVTISDAGKKFEILKYGELEFDAVIYSGVNIFSGFYKNGQKIDVVNTIAICQELSMSYDISVDIIPKLKARGVTVFTFLYPEIYTLNLIMKKNGYPNFQKKPFLHIMAQDEKFDEDLQKFFGEYYSKEYVKGILTRPSVIEVNGLRRFGDFNSYYYNIVNGYRATTNVPDDPKYTIHLFGKCVAMGRYVEDKNTVASFLQRKINRANNLYHVLNYGIEADVEINKKLRALKYKKGDIVILLYRYYDVYRKKGVDFKYLAPLICEKVITNREYFLDSPEHFNHIVNNLVAAEIFKTLRKDYYADTSVNTEEYFCLDEEEGNVNEDFIKSNPEFAEYIQDLKMQRRHNIRGKIGAIVMNCNPFTLGHRYLIEQAASQCGLLYIFVVQEDRSTFSFEDRFYLVKEGTKDLENVVVMPSGSFMISTMTFPEYFNKDNPSDVAIDPSNDVELFGRYIAQALGIEVRFAGEEPIDIVTKQYNDTMRRLLPSFGVEFKVIPRIEFEGEVISASRVRANLRVKNFIEIKKMVPETTFKFLLEKYN